MRLDVKKCCEYRDQEEFDNSNLSVKEKLNDFIEDHSDMCGCATLFTVMVLLGSALWGICHHINQSKKETLAKEALSIKVAAEIEPLFIQKLLPLVKNMNKKNASAGIQAAKQLVLMDKYDTPMVGLDLLAKKYLELYNGSENNVDFQDKVLLIRENMSFNYERKHNPSTPFPVQTHNKSKTFTQLIQQNSQEYTK